MVILPVAAAAGGYTTTMITRLNNFPVMAVEHTRKTSLTLCEAAK